MPTNPSTENYTLGRGRLYFAPFDANNNLLGERALGNAPAFTFSLAVEKLDHFSSMTGLKAKDKSVVTQVTPTVAFTLDEMSENNIKMLFMGTSSSVVQAADTDVTATFASIAVGEWYDIVDGVTESGAPAVYYNITNVTVTDGNVTTYVAGTDYTLDASNARIYFKTTAEGGALEDGDTVEIEFDVPAATYTVISGLRTTALEGQLRFVSDYPEGPNMQFTAWKVSLAPDGDTAFIGDDWSTIQFTGEILADDAGHPSNPYCQIVM